MPTNYLDTSCPKCHQKHTGECLDWPSKLTVESVIDDFKSKFSFLKGDVNWNTDQILAEQSDWLKEKLTTLQTQHREEVESAVWLACELYDTRSNIKNNVTQILKALKSN